MSSKRVRRRSKRVFIEFDLKDIEDFKNEESFGQSEGKKKNVTTFVNHLIDYFQIYSSDEVISINDERDIYRFILYYSQNKKISTIERYTTYLKKFIEFLTDRYPQYYFPSSLLKMKRIRNMLINMDVDFYESYEEQKNILMKFTRRQVRDFENKLCVALKLLTEKLEEEKIYEKTYDDIVYSVTFMYYTGVRIEEMKRVRYKDIDFENKIIRIKRSKLSKTTYIPLHTELERMIKIYVTKYGVGDGKIFRRKETSKLNKIVQEHGNFKEFQLKLLRKVFATKIYPFLKEEEREYLMGHTAITDTSYTGEKIRQIKRKYEQIDFVNLLQYTKYTKKEDKLEDELEDMYRFKLTLENINV